jgi:hypothetical protein
MLKKALREPTKESLPTRQQKDAMLNKILMEGRQSNITIFTRFAQVVTVYPWRFAIAGSVLQAIVLTLLFGTKYTNLFLNYFGG